jgi:integrase
MNSSSDRRTLPTNLERRGDKLYFRAVIGNKLYRKSTGFRDLNRAKRRAAEIEKAIRDGLQGWERKAIPTFGAWLDRFMDAFYPGKELEGYLVSRVRERWATRPLNLITPMDVREYVAARETQDHASPNSLIREMGLIKRVFRAAVTEKLIETNPCVGYRFKGSARTRILRAEHEAALRAALPADLARYLDVALGTGVRTGEERHFRPMDLRRDGTFIWVRPESNKTKKGREVPLTPAVRKLLQEQKASRPGDETTPYWPNLGPRTFGQLLWRLCPTLHIPTISPHDLRRTFGTRAAERGMFPKHLQMIMGHENIETTMRYYVSLETQSLVDALVKAGF